MACTKQVYNPTHKNPSAIILIDFAGTLATMETWRREFLNTYGIEISDAVADVIGVWFFNGCLDPEGMRYLLNEMLTNEYDLSDMRSSSELSMMLDIYTNIYQQIKGPLYQHVQLFFNYKSIDFVYRSHTLMDVYLFDAD